VRLVYIAGPYRSATPWGVRCNIRDAEDLAAKVHAAEHALLPATIARLSLSSA
jgi:hypothetical protein